MDNGHESTPPAGKLSRRTLLRGAAGAAAGLMALGLPLPRIRADYQATPEAEPAGNYKVMAVLLDINEQGNGEITPEGLLENLSGNGNQRTYRGYDKPIELQVNPRSPSVSEFFKVATNGKINMAFDIKQYRITLPPSKNCSYVGDTEDVVRPLLEKDGIPKEAYDSYVFITDQPVVRSDDCYFPAVTNSADAPNDFTLYDGGRNAHSYAISHELSHRLAGGDHAGQYEWVTEEGVEASYKGPIEKSSDHWQEYGDPYSILGGDGYRVWGFNIVDKIKLAENGFVDEPKLQEITTSGQYTIDDTHDGKIEGLKIPIPNRPGAFYFVSYPAPLQYKDDNPEKYQEFKDLAQQVQVRYCERWNLQGKDFGWGPSLLVGVNRTGAGTYVLDDEQNGIRVSTIDKNAVKQLYGTTDQAYVNVEFASPES